MNNEYEVISDLFSLIGGDPLGTPRNSRSFRSSEHENLVIILHTKKLNSYEAVREEVLRQILHRLIVNRFMDLLNVEIN